MRNESRCAAPSIVNVVVIHSTANKTLGGTSREGVGYVVWNLVLLKSSMLLSRKFVKPEELSQYRALRRHLAERFTSLGKKLGEKIK